MPYVHQVGLYPCTPWPSCFMPARYVCLLNTAPVLYGPHAWCMPDMCLYNRPMSWPSCLMSTMFCSIPCTAHVCTTWLSCLMSTKYVSVANTAHVLDGLHAVCQPGLCHTRHCSFIPWPFCLMTPGICLCLRIPWPWCLMSARCISVVNSAHVQCSMISCLMSARYVPIPNTPHILQELVPGSRKNFSCT